MKILGMIILVIGAVFSFGASKWLRLIRRTDEVSDQEYLVTKLLGLLIAVMGMIFVFFG